MSLAQARRRQLGAALSLVAAIVLTVLVAIPSTGTVGTAAVPPSVTAPVAASTVVVQPGETLWDVAVSNAPAGTMTGDYVAQLVEANGIQGGQLAEWQVLRLPAP